MTFTLQHSIPYGWYKTFATAFEWRSYRTATLNQAWIRFLSLYTPHHNVPESIVQSSPDKWGRGGVSPFSGWRTPSPPSTSAHPASEEGPPPAPCAVPASREVGLYPEHTPDLFQGHSTSDKFHNTSLPSNATEYLIGGRLLHAHSS